MFLTEVLGVFDKGFGCFKRFCVVSKVFKWI